jgi:hypothetical protein
MRIDNLPSVYSEDFMRPVVIAGVSLRTQELYALVFVTRYLDLFFNFISMYVITSLLIHSDASFRASKFLDPWIYTHVAYPTRLFYLGV